MVSPWTVSDVPDLAGKTALVTGANNGLGYWTALHLARRGARVVLACRSGERARAALAELLVAVPDGQFEVQSLDLADLDSVAAAAAEVGARYDRLDLLVNNAGFALQPKAVTAQGFESHYGVNFLGHFALTGRLLDLVTATPGSRVVHVGSIQHHVGRLSFTDPHYEHRRYTPGGAYGQSKLANVVFMLELERRLRRTAASTISLGAHPGMSGTGIAESMAILQVPGFRPTYDWLVGKVLNTAEMGAYPSLLAATRPGVAGGTYFGPRGLGVKGYPKAARMSRKARPEEAGRQLWELAERETGVRFLG
ncbi:MAG: hypothetical protein JWQ74_2993 [Marmoricola sp.]|nr:hypothetical protein [Marmoricola sp.]